MTDSKKRVIITGKYTAFSIELSSLFAGASGVLGTAVRNAFKASGEHFDVLALSFTQTGNDLLPLDLLRQDEVDRVFKAFKPHCE